jgi:hypothetical protein
MRDRDENSWRGPHAATEARARTNSQKIRPWVMSSAGTIPAGMKNAAPNEPG